MIIKDLHDDTVQWDTLRSAVSGSSLSRLHTPGSSSDAPSSLKIQFHKNPFNFFFFLRMKLESKIWYDREYICFAPTGETEREEMEAEGTSMPVPAFRHPGPSTPLLQPSPASSSCHAFSLNGLFNCIQSSLLHTIANAVFPLSCCSCPWQASKQNKN